jgi:hypothetical protein
MARILIRLSNFQTSSRPSLQDGSGCFFFFLFEVPFSLRILLLVTSCLCNKCFFSQRATAARYTCSSPEPIVRWVPCHHGTAPPQVADALYLRICWTSSRRQPTRGGPRHGVYNSSTQMCMRPNTAQDSHLGGFFRKAEAFKFRQILLERSNRER